MTTARINIKSIDYFKFKKLVIDGNRDDYNSCSKEVKSLCDCVQTLNFRDEEFDDLADRGRFEEICSLYKQILTSKRIDSLDMRIKSGWWGDHKNAYSAGKIKPAALKELLASKAQTWVSRHGDSLLKEKQINEKIDGPGLYVFKHREHQCFQYVGMAERIFAQCGEKLKAAFEGSSQDPLAALLIISMASDWDFYFIPVAPTDGDKVLRVLENDLILKHDCIWPHGLNFRLSISSLLEVSEFRKSCLRHHWPPDAEVLEPEINLTKLREQILKAPASPASEEAPSPPSSVKSVEAKPERPKSAKSQPSAKPAKPTQASPTQPEAPSKAQRPASPRKLPATPKPASPAKRPQSAKSTRPASAAARKTQKTPEPPEENGHVQEYEEQPSPVVEDVRPPGRKPQRPLASANKTSPKEEKPQPRKLPTKIVEAAPPPAPSPPEEQSPEEPSPEEEEVLEEEETPKEEPATVEEDTAAEEEDAPAAPLKRQGTYEVLPTAEDQCDEIEAAQNTTDEETGAPRPSRLPVCKN